MAKIREPEEIFWKPPCTGQIFLLSAFAVTNNKSSAGEMIALIADLVDEKSLLVDRWVFWMRLSSMHRRKERMSELESFLPSGRDMSVDSGRVQGSSKGRKGKKGCDDDGVGTP